MQVSDHMMKLLRAVLLSVAMVLIGILVADVANPPHKAIAQNSGQVGILSQMTPIFSGITATKCSGILPDIGQGSNILFVANTAVGGGVATADFEWSPTGSSPFYTITQANYQDVQATTHVLTMNGYFPNLRTCLTYTSGTYSVWYTATSGPLSYSTPGNGTSGATSPPVCDQVSYVSAANSVITFIGPHPVNTSSDQIVICGISVAYNAATSTGALEFEWSTAQSCSGVTQGFFDYTTSSTPQNYSIPTPQRSLVQSSQFYNYLCVNNSSGATAGLVISWASLVHTS